MSVDSNIIMGVAILKLGFDLGWAIRIFTMKDKQFEDEVNSFPYTSIPKQAVRGLIYSGRTIATGAILLRQIAHANRKIKETDKQIADLKTQMSNTFNIECPKCNHVYLYENPMGYKGRTPPCPKCKHQDLRK